MPAAEGNNYALNRTVNPQHTKEEIQEMIDGLLDWAQNGKGIYIASYIYEKYKKSKKWIYQLADHHPNLKEALDTTRELIAAKIGDHSFIGDRNSTFGEKILPIYCKEYKELLKWKAELAKQSNEDMKATADEFVKAIKANKLLDLLKQED